MESFTEERIIEIAKKINQLYQEEMSKLPYSANAIDELHANENAHSRILRMLLQYRGGQTWPVYSSFLNLINSLSPFFSLKCNSPIFVNERDRIDLLIKDISSYTNERWAIIIENKICNAVDQDTQIERYLEKVIRDVPPENIYVIYLTSDGTKTISANSLTARAQKILDYKNEADAGRFITLNYKSDILPWIEEEVLPSIAIKEDLLISSIKLYIDYLKGMFGLRNNEQIIHNKIQTKMGKMMNIDNISDGFKMKDDLDRLTVELNKLIQKKANEILKKHLYDPLSVFLTKYDGMTLDNIEFYSDCQFTCRIELKNWEKVNLLIAPQNRKGIYGIAHKNLYDNPLDNDTISILKSRFSEYKSTPWWPVNNTLDYLDDAAGTTDLWISIENGKFCSEFEKWIEDVMEKTEGLSL